MKHITLKLAKHLDEGGFKGESEKNIRVCSFCKKPLRTKMVCDNCNKRDVMNLYIATYSYYEILVDYAKELFRKDALDDISVDEVQGLPVWQGKTFSILSMLQADNPDYNKIDKYIISNLAEKWQVKK